MRFLNLVVYLSVTLFSFPLLSVANEVKELEKRTKPIEENKEVKEKPKKEAFNEEQNKVPSNSVIQNKKNLPQELIKDPIVRAIKIIVKEKGSGDLLKKVEVKSQGNLCFTNLQGFCELSLTKKSKKIDVYRSGYRKLVIDLKVLKDKKEHEVYLYPAQPDDNTVIIYGKQKKEVSKKQISIEEAVEVAPRGDPAQITKLLPGVQQAQVFSPQIVVRGSAPNDSRYYIDNLDLPFVYHGVGGISVIPKELLSDVIFESGAFDSRYGEATGGIIKLKTKDEIAKKRQTDFIVNLPLYSSVFHNQPLGENDSISASLRYSYLDVLFDNFFPDSLKERVVVLPSFGDGHVQWLHKTGDGIQKITLITSFDRLKLSVQSSNAPESGKLEFDILTMFGALGFERKGKLSKTWRYLVAPHVIYTKVDNKVIDSTIDIEGPTYRIPFYFTKRLGKDERWRLGSEFQLSLVDISIFAPKFDTDSPFPEFEDAPEIETKVFYQNYFVSLWTDIDKSIGPFILTPGVRGFYSSDIKKFGGDPRMRILYRFSKANQLKFAVGQYSKPPSPQETDKDFGNPDLNFERSYQGVVGWETDWSQKWKTDLQIYYKRNYSVIRSDKDTNYNNDGEIESKGLEVFIRRNKTGRAFAWLSYSLSFNKERDNKDSKWYTSRYDQTHVVNLVGGYSLTGQWSLGARINYHTGDTYTGIEDSVYNTSFAKYQRRFGEKNNKRLPDYHQIDLYTTYSFLFDTWKLKLRSGVEYISFTRPTFGTSYNYDYTKEELLEGLPPVPFIEIQGTL